MEQGGKDPQDEAPETPVATDGRVATLIDGVVDHSLRWGILTAIIGLGPGLVIWSALHYKEIDYLLANDLTIEHRKQLLLSSFATLALTLIIYTAVHFRRRMKGVATTFADSAVAINRRALLVAPLAILFAFGNGKLETDHPFLLLTIIGIATGVFAVWCHRLLVDREADPTVRARAHAAWLPAVSLIGIAAFYAGYVSYLALTDHRNFGTHIYDLALYDNIFWRTSHGDFLGCSYCRAGEHVSAHFDPVIGLLAPIYLLAPRAETLLVLQTVWLATGVFPLYLLAVRRLGDPWFGVALAAVYVMSPALHGANMFDFHSLTLAIPTLIWAVYLIDAGSRWRYAAVLALLLVTREDLGLLACFLGVYAISVHRRMLGFATIVASVIYVALVKVYAMNDPGLLMQESPETHSYIYYYEDMIPHREEGVRGLVISFFTNPVFVLKMLFIDKKVLYFLQLLGPLLFLPLFAGRKVFAMLYGFVFIGLASRKHVYSIHFQYSTVLFPLLMAAMPDAIDRLSHGRIASAFRVPPRRAKWLLMWTVVFATALVSAKFGVLVPNGSFKAGWNRPTYLASQESKDRYAAVQEMLAEIPPDAPVSTTTGLGPHVSNRAAVAQWPRVTDAEYLLVNAGGFKKKDQQRLKRMLDRGEFRILQQAHGIVLLARVPPDERDAAREEAKSIDLFGKLKEDKAKEKKDAKAKKKERAKTKTTKSEHERKEAEKKKKSESESESAVDEPIGPPEWGPPDEIDDAVESSTPPEDPP